MVAPSCRRAKKMSSSSSSSGSRAKRLGPRGAPNNKAPPVLAQMNGFAQIQIPAFRSDPPSNLASSSARPAAMFPAQCPDPPQLIPGIRATSAVGETAPANANAVVAGVVVRNENAANNPQPAKARPACCWARDYEPAGSADLAVHKSKVNEVRDYLCSGNSTQSVLLLIGPPGCGKATTLRTVAKEVGLAFKQWVSPSEKIGDSFFSFLREGEQKAAGGAGGSSMIRTSYKANVLCLKDFPFGLVDKDPREFREKLADVLSLRRSYRLALLGNDTEDFLFRKIFQRQQERVLAEYRRDAGGGQVLPQLHILKFNAVAPTILDKAIGRILTLSGTSVHPGMREGLKQCGDLRQAAVNLQFYGVQDAAGAAAALGPRAKAAKKPKAKAKKRLGLLGGSAPSGTAPEDAASHSQQLMVNMQDREQVGVGGNTKSAEGQGSHLSRERISRIDNLHFFHALGRILYAKRCEPKADVDALVREFNAWKEREAAEFWRKFHEQHRAVAHADSPTRVVPHPSSDHRAETYSVPATRRNPAAASDLARDVLSAGCAPAAFVGSLPRGPREEVIEIVTDSEEQAELQEDCGPAAKRRRLSATSGAARANGSLVAATCSASNPGKAVEITTEARPRLFRPADEFVSREAFEKKARQLSPEEARVKSVRPESYFDLEELVEVQEPRLFTDFLFTNAPMFMGDIGEYEKFATQLAAISGRANLSNYNILTTEDLELSCREYLDANVHCVKPGGSGGKGGGKGGGGGLYQFRRSRIVDVDREQLRNRLEGHYYQAELVVVGGGGVGARGTALGVGGGGTPQQAASAWSQGGMMPRNAGGSSMTQAASGFHLQQAPGFGAWSSGVSQHLPTMTADAAGCRTATVTGCAMDDEEVSTPPTVFEFGDFDTYPYVDRILRNTQGQRPQMRSRKCLHQLQELVGRFDRADFQFDPVDPTADGNTGTKEQRDKLGPVEDEVRAVAKGTTNTLCDDIEDVSD